MTGTVGRLLRRFTGGRRMTNLFVEVPIQGPLWAVGDIHGCLSLYLELEQMVAREAVATGQAQTIVVLGDMIDRGPDVKGVLDHLQSPPPPNLERKCLMGNHEDMLLRFLSKPFENRAWLTFGAWPTLGSYGISPDPDVAQQDSGRLASELRDAMGDETISFLESLPAGLISGSFILAHAGTAPETALAKQTRHDLIWARHGEVADLLPPSDLGNRIVVHGHVPVETPCREGWRINIDTGAFATGRLTAVRLVSGEPPRFVTTGTR